MGGLRMLRDHGIIKKLPSSQFMLSINMMQVFFFPPHLLPNFSLASWTTTWSVGMDANVTVNPLIDRSFSTMHWDPASQYDNDFIVDNDSRMENENYWHCTFYSSQRRTFPRIDYILISRYLIQYVNRNDILPMMISVILPFSLTCLLLIDSKKGK